mgnify:CR=1 FL=1|jgi:hypothetical protein|tara:strand:- start:792 stop:1166 length:375 start_codon:yes stop_codon:yes gene_type:complete
MASPGFGICPTQWRNKLAKEFRRITFNKNEMRDALELNASNSGDNVPPGEIVSLKSSRQDDNFFFELGLFDHAKQKEDNMTLPEEDALNALINHSINMGIPLARAARKEVRDIDGLLCLDMFLE